MSIITLINDLHQLASWMRQFADRLDRLADVLGDEQARRESDDVQDIGL